MIVMLADCGRGLISLLHCPSSIITGPGPRFVSTDLTKAGLNDKKRKMTKLPDTIMRFKFVLAPVPIRSKYYYEGSLSSVVRLVRQVPTWGS
jgi:hypothetical protein